jgi:hypothetical protein
MRYSVMDAWMTYMAPIAPPALLNIHSERSVLRATGARFVAVVETVGESWGYSVVRFARMWSIIRDVFVPQV